MLTHLRTLLVIVFVVVGCASSPAASETSDGTSTSAAQGDESPSLADIEYESPLAEFLGQDVNQFDFDEAAALDQQRQAEQAIATCMAAEGFEYIPKDPSQFMSFGGPPDEEFEPGSTEWVNKYGFGISTQRFPQSMVGDLVGMSDEGFIGPDDDFVDPNAEYVESLSEGERDAYYEALYGLPPDVGPEGPGEDFEFEPEGCQFEAFRDGPGGPDENVRAFYEAFGDEVSALYERIEADSRVVAFNNEVGACVAEAGMEWTGFRDVYEQFEPRLNELQPEAFGPGRDPLEEAGLDPEQMTDREIDEFYRELSRLSPEQLEILAEIQADEIALAKAVIACGGGPGAEQALMNTVRVEYEQDFLEQNADALAEYAGDG